MARDRVSEDALALFERGQKAYQQGDHREAVECFTRAIRLRPDVAAAYRYRAYAYREMGDRLSALNDLDTAIRLNPQEVQNYVDRAMVLFAQKAYDQAIADCDRVLSLDPGRGAIYGLRGRCHAAVGNSEQAIRDFGTALEADPENAARYLEWRAELCLECGLTDQVLADGERLTQLEPSNPYARSLQGYASLAQQRFHEALEYFHQAIQLDPELLTARIGRIQAYLQLRQGMEAEADCTAILSLKSEDSVVAIAYELRGLARRLQGRWQDACADFTAALQHNPTVELYNRRAEMYYYAGEYAAALRDHMQALKLDPHNPQTLNMLAWIWSTCPDPEFRNGPRAKECATRACELTEWSEPGLIDTLAAACAECGDYDLAVQWQTRAVELVEQKGNANDTTRQDYQARCELYRQRKPFRTPWGPLSQLLP